MEQVSWKEKVMNHFFELEDDIERDPNVWVLELNWWKFIILTVAIVGVMSMTIFSYMYTYKMYHAVNSICTAPIHQKGLYTTKGGMFTVSTSHGSKLVILEPLETDSTTHRHLKCTIPEL